MQNRKPYQTETTTENRKHTRRQIKLTDYVNRDMIYTERVAKAARLV